MKPVIEKAIPFFAVADMERSLQFYMQGLGFEMINKWTPREKIEWCMLQNGGATIMLQQFNKKEKEMQPAPAKVGEGVTICFNCSDAVGYYRLIRSNGIIAGEPFVGNGLWVTTIADPDGYRLEFESITDVPEETRLSEIEYK